MSNIIPPLLSDTPPPPPDVDDHDEDEFGDFIGTNNVSFDCDDGCSPPGSPLQLPVEPFDFERIPPEITDLNSNSKPSKIEQISELNTTKDFHDKRKDAIIETLRSDQLFNNASFSVNTVECLPDGTQLNKTEIIETNCDKEKTFSSQSEIIKISSENLKDHQSPSKLEENLQPINSPTDLSEPTSSVVENGVNVNNSSNSNISRDLEELNPRDELEDTSSALNQQILADNLVFENCQASPKPTENRLDEISSGSPSPDLGKDNFRHVPNDSETLQSPIKYADRDFDDFDDFKSSALEDSQESNADFFADFDSLPAKPDQTPEDDEFCDFVTPQAAQETVANIPEFANFDSFPCSTDAEDDFGDFTATTAHPESQLENGKILLLNETQALEKATQIVQEMFPPPEQLQPDFTFSGLEAEDAIFNQIKNITDTHALSYHWAKSASQKLLLKSLNIDSRNIMFGPGWNPAMPRFASSLSVQPLEPVKSEILTPIPIKDLRRPSAGKEPATADGSKMGEVPLMEPIASLPAKEASSAPTASSIGSLLELKESKCDSIELSKQTPHTDLEAKSGQLKDFDGFVSHLPPVNQTASHGHNIILRETHICNKEPSKNEDTDIVSWLEPTIVTPELTRKERQFVEGDEEFDDFQMIVADNPADNANGSVKTVAVLQPHSVVNQGGKVADVKSPRGQQKGEEDDFGEFTFSVPNSANQVKTEPPAAPAALPLLEPLRPLVVKGQNVASISWPDPGVTDDEISRFEALGYARTQQQELSKKGAVPALPQPKSTPKSTQNGDDDEWSDFVSVQNSSPIHKLKVEKERSSTPDLPLSVLNLGTVHPTKQPIPVITPNGLMQTKLSSNMPLNLSNKVPQKNKVFPQTQAQSNHVYQPSIISNQFASQAYGGFNTYQPQANSLKSSTEDDEWSDFVSHQPSMKPQQNQFPGWSGVSPNLMHNSVAGFNLSGPVKKVSTSKNTAISNVSVPDLDFLAPRSRTTNRK